jgi:hypothetical protein
MDTTETPFLTFWRAVDAALVAANQTPATGGEIDIYAKFNMCDLAAAKAVAWRITCDRDPPDLTEASRAAQSEFMRERHTRFLEGNEYP